MVDETYPTTTGEAPASRHGRPVAYGGPAEERKMVSPMAITALALAVIGFIIPIVPSVLALAIGYPARKRIDADPDLRGDGMALTGIILGWVALALYVTALLFIQFGGV